VGKHEHFETLCAAASVGQASGAELAELREHLATCGYCRQTYSEFLQLGAVRCATDSKDQEVTGTEALGYIDSALFREKFLKKAQDEGIVISPRNLGLPMADSLRGVPKGAWATYAGLTIAASVLLVLGAVGGYRLKSSRVTVQSVDAFKPTEAFPSRSPQGKLTDQALETSISRLEGENRRLISEIASLKGALAAQSSTLNELQVTAATSEKERASVVSVAKERDTTIDDLQHRLNQAQAEVTSVRAQLESDRAANQATVAADQARIGELSDQLGEQSASLEREREMLTANKDIRDLMAARNLHIADIFDTDTRGKTRAAFGRVFFTEGKSLIIYAYDLNDHRVQDAGYHYRVWGKREGPSQRARSLGMFYSDDKSQKRWVFKYDDPKVLSEIDSVFVTLEPPGKNPTEPKGDKFLYAYLRNQPNHP
jgi:hypothetical protein